MIALHLNAGHNANGNPRRVFVVLDDDGDITDVVNEAYSGTAKLRAKYPDIKVTARFDTSVSEYDYLLKNWPVEVVT